MASSAEAADDRRSSAPLNLHSDVLSILRRSSAIFFSSSLIGPLLSLASFLLFLFLFQSLILHLSFRCTASLMKHHDSSTPLITIYYQIIAFLLFLVAFFGYLILFSALHSLHRSPDQQTTTHGCIVHLKYYPQRPPLCLPQGVLLSSRLIQRGCSLFFLSFNLTSCGHSLVLHPLLIHSLSALVMMMSVAAINLAPWVLLFLDPATDEERIMTVWYGVKKGCYLLLFMSCEGVAIKIMEKLVCGKLRMMDLGAIMAAGGWRGLFVVLAVKSVVEAFFVVVWLVFYVAARRKAAAVTRGHLGCKIWTTALLVSDEVAA